MERKILEAPALKRAAGDGSFTAVIATLGVVDADGDVVEPGAFPTDPVPILPAHDKGSVHLGKAWIVERGDHVIAEGEFNLDVPLASDWHSALKFDLEYLDPVQEWSWGFEPAEAERETRDGEPVRVLRKVDLVEVSPVLRGASVGTRTTCVGDSCRVGAKCAPGVCGCGEQALHKATQDFIAYAGAVADEIALEGFQAQARILREAEECERRGLVRYKAVAMPSWCDWIPALAEEMADAVGVPVPEVKLIRPCGFGQAADVIHEQSRPERELLGFVEPASGVIYLADGMSRRDTLETLGHEMVHIYQYVNELPASEKAASEAGEKIAALYDSDIRRFELKAMRAAA